MNRSLRCYGYGGRNSWQAICVDLDIAVQGRSINEVKDSLRVCVEMYLSAVADTPVEDQHRLLNRRSPWYVRAKLASLAWVLWSGPAGMRAEEFRVPVHLTAQA